MTTSVRAPLETTTGYPADLAARYLDAGYWTDETFQQFLSTRAAVFGHSVAVVGPDAAGIDRSLTYRELSDRADRIAAGLQSSGVHLGDRVVVQLPNIVEYVEVIFAVFRLGALPVFALPAHRAQEISYFCSFADAAAYVITDTHAGFDYRGLARDVVSSAENPPTVIVAGDAEEFTSLDELRAAEPLTDEPAVGPESVAFLQLSGGTTGVSKLIPRTGPYFAS